MANYPFCTIDPNVGVVPVPDRRLEAIAQITKPERLTPAMLEFIDVAGLVKGAHRGEGLGNQFLSHIREVDVVVHVVRCFDDPDITHVDGDVNPVRDIEVVETELVLKDLETVEKRMEKTGRMIKTGEKRYVVEMERLERLKAWLERGESIRAGQWDDEEQSLIAELFLLSAKPVIYAANVSEDDLLGASAYVQDVKRVAEKIRRQHPGDLRRFGGRDRRALTGRSAGVFERTWAFRARAAPPDPAGLRPAGSRDVLHGQGCGNPGVGRAPGDSCSPGGRQDSPGYGAGLHPGRGGRLGKLRPLRVAGHCPGAGDLAFRRQGLCHSRWRRGFVPV